MKEEYIMENGKLQILRGGFVGNQRPDPRQITDNAEEEGPLYPTGIQINGLQRADGNYSEENDNLEFTQREFTPDPVIDPNDRPLFPTGIDVGCEDC